MSDAGSPASAAIAVDVGAPAEAAPEAAPAIVPRHKVKIDNVESEVELDELIKNYQAKAASDKRFREASDLSKKAKADLEAFKKNPWGKLKELGEDPYELAERLLIEKMEFEGLTAEGRRALTAEFELAKIKEAQQEQENAKSQSQKQQAYQQALQEVDTEIGEALASSGFKPTPRFIRRIAETLYAHHSATDSELAERYGDQIPEEAWSSVKRTSAKDVMGSVEKEFAEDVWELFKNIGPEKALAMIPPEIRDSWREHEVSKVLSQDPAGSRKPRSEPEVRRRPKEVRGSTDSFFKKMDEKFHR